MEHLRRRASILLALLLVLATISTTAFADENFQVETLQKGKWYKLLYYSNAKTIYKLSLANDSIVTISWKGNKAGQASLYFCTDKKCDDWIKSCIHQDKSSGSETAVLNKGTYYIRTYDWEENPTSQAKITVQKPVNQENYCRAKAVNLKPNNTVKIAQTANYCYDRWYKITLNNKRSVTITTDDNMANYIALYDSRMQQIECTYGSRKVITEDSLKKGTYFIRAMVPYGVDEYLGTYMTLMWK